MNREKLKEGIDDLIWNHSKKGQVNEIMILIDLYTNEIRGITKGKSDCVSESKLIITDADKVIEFSRWINYRKSLRKTIKVKDTIIRLAKKFNDTDIETIRQVVNHSIDNQYQGLFWDKINNNGQSTTKSKADLANDWLDSFND